MARQSLLFGSAGRRLAGELVERWQATMPLLSAPAAYWEPFSSSTRLSCTLRSSACLSVSADGGESERLRHTSSAAGHVILLHRGFAAAVGERTYGRSQEAHSGKTSTSAEAPDARNDAALRSNPPKPTSAPLPYPESCPDIGALAQHIQTHGPSYSLKHVAAGLNVLATLAASGLLPSNLEELVQGSILKTAPTTAQCARRLAALGHYSMRREVDIAAIASCINTFAGLNDHAFAAELWMPFVDRLRDASYYYALHRADAEVLVALTHALGKLKPFKYMDTERRKTLGQIVRRLISCLGAKVSDLSAEDAVRVTQALARLRRRSYMYAEDMSLLMALAARVSSDLVENDLLQPDQAVRMLWAYGQLLPRPRDAASSQGQSAAAPPTAASVEAAAQPARSYDAEAVGQRIAPMVTGSLRVACRSLESHPPLELVKLAIGVGKLCTQQQAAAVLSQVTPVLLRNLASLDNSALTDVVYAYSSVGMREPGLFDAIAERIITSDLPLTLRDAYFLALCYGRGGCSKHNELWALIREGLRSAVPEYKLGTLRKLLTVLYPADTADAEVAALMSAEMRNMERHADGKTGAIDE